MSRSITSKAPPASSYLRATLFQPLPLRARFTSIQQPSWVQSRQCLLRKKLAVRTFPRSYSNKPPASTRTNLTSNLNSPEPHSLTARLKKLSREYGWTVIGVYLALTVADLPLCFLAVKYIGAERVAYAEDVIVGGAKDLVGRVFPNLFEKKVEQQAEIEAAKAEKDQANGEPTIWTQLGLVFLVHKSFIFIRVPLTAAITPKVVKTLRSWGYNIGKRTPKKK